MKKNLIYPFLFTSFIAFSQEKYNPFEGIGKSTEVVTLSNGKYKEIYGGDTLKRIGSVIFDTKNNKVVQFLAEDDTVTMVVKKEGDYATRWLSLDPLAAKYPSMSPYNFVGNSPILFIDPDGRDWKITITQDQNGNKTIHVKLTAAILESKLVDEQAFMLAIKSQLRNTYEIEYVETEAIPLKNELDRASNNTLYTFKNVKVELDFDIKVIQDEKELRPDQHLIEVISDEDMLKMKGYQASATAHKLGGKRITFSQSAYEQSVKPIDGNRNIIPHEFGHTLGLRHINKFFQSFWYGQYYDMQKQRKNPNNIMYTPSEKTNTQINSEQMKTIVKEYEQGNLNQEE